MAGNIVLVCLFILGGIAGSSITAEITKKAAVKTSDEKQRGVTFALTTMADNG